MHEITDHLVKLQEHLDAQYPPVTAHEARSRTLASGLMAPTPRRWAAALFAAAIILVLIGGIAISLIAFGSNEDVIEQTPTPTISTPTGGSWEAIAPFEPLAAFFYTFGEQHAIYDIESDLVLSYQVFDPPLTWLFDANGAEWSSVEPTHPGTRSVSQDSGIAAYDPITDRVIVFDDQRSTFAVNVDTGAWTDLAPAPGPSVRVGAAMVYDTQSELAVMFGGRLGHWMDPWAEETLNDTWTFDPAQNLWSEQSPLSSPPPRLWHSMVYDSQSDRVVLFGGASGDGWQVSPESSTANSYPEIRSETHVYGDTWVYDTDTATWTEMHPPISPAPRIWAAMWYDPVADLVFLYAGATEVNRWPLPSSTMLGGEELWAYDLETNDWTLFQLGSPNPGYVAGATGVFDVESGFAVLFGGGRYNPETNGKGANTTTWIYRHVE
jgi:hypothetical protein